MALKGGTELSAVISSISNIFVARILPTKCYPAFFPPHLIGRYVSTV